MNDDLRVNRAIEEGKQRARAYRPTVMVTQSFKYVVVCRPEAYQDETPVARGWVAWMKEHLPEFKFDAKHGWWYADISHFQQAREAMDKRMAGCNYSKGAVQWFELINKEGGNG